MEVVGYRDIDEFVEKLLDRTMAPETSD